MEKKTTLKEKLADLKAENLSKVTEEIKNVLLKDLQSLSESGIIEKAPKVGEKFKAFSLSNHLGKEISLSSLTEKGPVVVTFYRGGWCPYCNLQLGAYQKALPEIQAAGATLVAITPESPDASMTTQERHNIEFEVLTDLGSAFAKELGITFSLSEETRPIYKQWGINLDEYNKENAFELPLAATFIIDTDGTITYSFYEADYTQRAEPADIIKKLKEMK